MSDNNEGSSKFDKLLNAAFLAILGVVFGAIIGFFDGGLFQEPRSLGEVMYPWSYILGGVLGVMGYLLPRFASLVLLLLSSCQFPPH